MGSKHQLTQSFLPYHASAFDINRERKREKEALLRVFGCQFYSSRACTWPGCPERGRVMTWPVCITRGHKQPRCAGVAHIKGLVVCRGPVMFGTTGKFPSAAVVVWERWRGTAETRCAVIPVDYGGVTLTTIFMMANASCTCWQLTDASHSERSFVLALPSVTGIYNCIDSYVRSLPFMLILFYVLLTLCWKRLKISMSFCLRVLHSTNWTYYSSVPFSE